MKLDAGRDNAMVKRSPVEAVLQTGADRWLVLDNPVRVLEAWEPEGVTTSIEEVERLTRDAGYYAAGFVGYEAGAGFGLPDGRARNNSGTGLPLAWFALFEPTQVQEVDALPEVRGDEPGHYELGPLTPSITFAEFGAAFARVREHLALGDTYQVNFTFSLRADFRGNPRQLFADLVKAQRGSCSAFLHTGSHAICSASPELFFSLDGLNISARPMKGTAPRGRTTAEDRARRDELLRSMKQRAENVMIVDMVRNDLGKIADTGSVDVPELFRAERYPNLWQMTSLVTARTRACLSEIFAAVHPSASVTGAPKVRTMEILDSLERAPRGVYTGAIGYVRPDGDARFSVAIRTAVVAPDEGTLEFGVGSGIVWDSDAAAEYEECLLKGSVLARTLPTFELLTTTAWTPDAGFMLIERHLARLRESADYFGFAFEEASVRSAMAEAVDGAERALRVRVLVAEAGSVRVEHQPLASREERPVRIALATEPIDPRDPFFFHKTTNRKAYDRARIDGVDDVVLWNPRNEITEATTANVAVELPGGILATPPVDCGLLAGTFRGDALDRAWLKEQVVTVAELRAATKIWLMNSVHGAREAVLVEGGNTR
jgi:para-aminobenzoate synthetase/4-amino-4-deoxychorismate lyase